jgi:hypothetical protein
MESTTVIATGEIGPKGPKGDPGPPGDGIVGPRGYGGATFSMDGNLVTRIGTQRWRVIGSQSIAGVVITVGESPVGSDIVVDVNLNGASIFSDVSLQPNISPGGNDSGVRFPTITEASEGDYFTVDVDDVGSTFPGADLTVQVLTQ